MDETIKFYKTKIKSFKQSRCLYFFLGILIFLASGIIIFKLATIMSNDLQNTINIFNAFIGLIISVVEAAIIKHFLELKFKICDLEEKLAIEKKKLSNAQNTTTSTDGRNDTNE